MNSPFKMKPGRGNMPKTGRGIPPTLMNCSPMKQEESMELTGKHDDKKKKYEEARNAPGKIEDLASTQGIKVDVATGGSTAIPYGYTYEQGKYGQRDRIINTTTGKISAEAKTPTNRFGDKNEELWKQFNNEKTRTEKQRASNSAKYNIGSGFTSTNEATKEQKEFLLNTGRAKL